MIHFKTFLEEDAEELEKTIMEWLKKIGNGREIDRSAPAICCDQYGRNISIAVTVKAETIS